MRELDCTALENLQGGSWLGDFGGGMACGLAIGMAWGTDAGYAINPARDFGPRLAAFFTGYGSTFRDQYGHLYFWIPIVGPLIGALVGGGLYRGVISRYLPTEAQIKAGA